jgi:integrase
MESRRKGHLTKKSVEGLPTPEAGEEITWDTRLTGYGVRVSSKGRRTYLVQARTRAGCQVKMKIGVHGTITAERAREIAARELGKIAAGDDPAEEKRQAKAAETKRLAIPTVAQLSDRYLAEHAEIYKRQISVRDDRAMIETIVKPAIGSKRVPDVEKADIEGLHRSMRETPYRANRALALLSKMFTLAMSWKLCPENPVKFVQRYDEQPRERYLSPAELNRLAVALADHPNQVTANAIRLLLLTGARRGEVLHMTWEQVEQEPGMWIKPAANTKTRKEHRLPLAPGALQIIEEMRRYRKNDDSFVFPGRSKNDRPVVELKATWEVVTEKAGISGVRVHDLRHCFASLLVNSGASLPLIGRLLGHTQPKTTQRYAHLADDPLREATGRVDAQLGAFTGRKPAAAEVVSLPSRTGTAP